MRSLGVFFLLIIGFYVSWGQENREQVQTDSVQATTPAAPGHTTPRLKHDETFSEENSITRKPHEVPATLQTTLQDPIYTGWQNGSVRQHMQTGEFEVVVIDGSEKKTFYFNSNGERIARE